LHHEIRPGIPLVVELLKDSDLDICRAAIKCISSLEAEGMYFFVHLTLSVILRLPDSGLDPAFDSFALGIAEAFRFRYSPGCD
jgi:hypothetical protein